MPEFPCYARLCNMYVYTYRLLISNLSYQKLLDLLPSMQRTHTKISIQSCELLHYHRVYPNHLFSSSYIKNINALLGIDLAIVMPHPAYKPLIPLALYIALKVPKKVDLGPLRVP